MLAKVIRKSRAEAALRLERALHGARVHGVTTNLSRSSGLARASTCTGPVRPPG
jgi:acetyl/propionyl-CoA carboxylase alpha subunit